MPERFDNNTYEQIEWILETLTTSELQELAHSMYIPTKYSNIKQILDNIRRAIYLHRNTQV